MRYRRQDRGSDFTVSFMGRLLAGFFALVFGIRLFKRLR